MKTILFTITAMVALLFVGCTKDVETSEPGNGKGIQTLSADMAQFESTRTGLGEENNGAMPILWRTGDAIAATGAEGTAIYTLSKGADSQHAEFTFTSGTAPSSITSAVYPAAAAATKSIPNTQSYMAGSFDPAAAVMTWDNTTTPTNGQIAFKHVGSVVCLQLTGTGETVKEVRVALTPKDGGEAKTYTLTSTEGVTLSATATPFYIVVSGDATANATYTTKFTILTAAHGMMVKEPATAKSFAPATLVRFAPLAYTQTPDTSSMQFTIDLAGQSNKSYTLPFATWGTVAHALTIDWGDGATTPIAAGYDLSTAITHPYAEQKAYQITITSTQTDPTQAQIPDFRPGNNRIDNNNPAKLKSMDSPMLNMGMTDFSQCFRNCSGLTSIPAGLFDHNTQVTNFNSCFSDCRGLTSIPAGLFDNNTQVTTFASCFYLCSSLTSIPTGLFDHNPNVTSFGRCFSGCTNLTSIPAGLFDKNPQVTSFDNCFNASSGITSIPAGLFDNNTLVESFQSCFYSGIGLTSIPEKLFANNTKVTNFSNCFVNCSELVLNANIFCDEATEMQTRFKDQSVNFGGCFRGCGSDSSGGTAPALWSYDFGTGTPVTTGCFSNVTKVTNASEIPTEWKV